MTRLALALRLARRDASRAPGRTLLTLAMVALPVMAVTAADLVLSAARQDAPPVTPDLGPKAEALIRVEAGAYDLQQDVTGQLLGSASDDRPAVRPQDVAALLPEGSRLAVVQRGLVGVPLVDGPGRVRAVLADPTDPLLAGRFTVARGDLPERVGEVAVGEALLAAADLEVGGRTTDTTGRPLEVVGVLEEGSGEEQLLALPGTTGLTGPSDRGPELEAYVDSPGPVTREDVLELNRIGAAVTSRALLGDREPLYDEDELYSRPAGAGPGWVVAGLALSMAVLQIVLLAGPAFAVGARRRRRELAQLAAAGGRPADGSLVVLAGAGLLGTLAAAVGLAAGIGLVTAFRAASGELDTALAGLALPVLDLVLIAGAAVASCVLAAAATARGVDALDPVSVLADRPEGRPLARSTTLAGLVVLAVGVVTVIGGARTGEYAVAVAAVPTVLGAVLLAPLGLRLAARSARGLPFPLRHAARDAARQRLRAAPVVGAITAVVAAAVALGIGNQSDREQSRFEDAVAQRLPATVSANRYLPSGRQVAPPDWDRLAQTVRSVAPGTAVTTVRGLGEDYSGGGATVCLSAARGPAAVVGPQGPPAACDLDIPLSGLSTNLGSTVLVGAASLAALGDLVTVQEIDRARATLAAGGVVALSDETGGPREVDVQAGAQAVRVPVTVLRVPTRAPFLAVLSDRVADELELAPVPLGLVLTGPVDEGTRAQVQQALEFRAPEAYLMQPPSPLDREEASRIAMLVLAGLSAALVLGGSLTATLLALAEARPDLTTLATLGASGAARRTMAAGYAAVLGVVGALLGSLAGGLVGVAVAHPLTQDGAPVTSLLPAYFDVPWLLVLLLVVGVPALAAAVAALTARGTPPGPQRRALA